MAFRIGRVFAKHTYPETPRSQPAGAFARNSGTGPVGAPNTPLPVPVAGVQIPWSTREVAAVAPTDIPITPKSTAALHISGMFMFRATVIQDASVALEFNGTPIGQITSTVDVIGEGNGTETIPFDLTIPAGLLPVGTTTQVEVKVSATADDTSLVLVFATLSIQEVQAATG